MKKIFSLLIVLLPLGLLAQIATGYQVGTWYGFKKVAITYSFDDNTSNQIPVAVPLLNKYNFKATFNPVVNWVGGSWSGWQTLATAGHEIASHTVSHATLPNISVSEQDTECKNSQSTIRTSTGSECVTISYPNCNVGDKTTLAKYFIAGRTCDGQTASNNPSDFFTIGSIICGSQGAMKTASDFNTRISNAVASQGWCVFLIHGVDNDGGYSPLTSTEFDSHLGYVNTNASTYWVAPFVTVAKYIKERNALALTETAITTDSLRVVATHNLSSTVTTYNTPLTVRRELPSGWTGANVYKNSTKITSTIVTDAGKTYVMFDVVPNDGTMFIAKTSSTGGGGGTTTFTELLTNGEMDSGTTGWTAQNNNSAQSTLSAVTNANLSGTNAIQICPNASNFGTADWHIQVYQNVTLETNKEYTFSFMAKAASARTITVMFQQLAADYAVYKTFTYNLTTTAQTFTETFTLTGTVDPASKISFCIGNNAACVSIDKVSFGYGTTGVDPVDPTDPPVGNGQGAYYTDVYTNVFKEVLNKTDAEVTTKLNAAFQHFFYGTTNQKLYYEVGTDMAYILDVANNDVRSEGMSYGLMICVQLNKQAEFNKLWKWTKTYMQHTSGTLDGFFRWQLNTNGTAIDNNPAPDGEAYFITALFFAAHRWGNGTGIYNYEAEAQSAIQKVQTGTGGVDLLFNTNSKLITFGPNGDSYTFTDPSYNLPGFFELWAKWSTSNTTFWAQTPEASRKLLRDASHPTSGLSTDYSNFDGTPKEVSYNTNSDRFMYDAWRTVMNIGMDYHWFRSDSTNQRAIITRYLTFFKNQGSGYKNHYDWNGANAGGDHSTGLVACNAAACVAVNDNTLRTPFLNEFWNIALPTGTYRYYDGMLYMLAFLNCSGNFKIWKPTPTCTTPAAPTVTTPVTYCQGATATALTATGTTLKWYTVASGGTASTTAPTPSTATVGNTTHYVSQTVSGCESARASIVVSVTALPTAPTVTTPVSYNQGATATALSATGTSLTWYTTSTGGTGSTSAPIPSTSNIGTTNYYVSQTISSCESQRANIQVIIIQSEITQTIQLEQGWNLISTYVQPTSSTCVDGLGNSFHCISSVVGTSPISMIKNANGFWKQGQPAALQSLTYIETGKGYLVYANTPTTLSFIGIPVTTGIYNTPNTGWYLIGYPCTDAMNIVSSPISNYYNSSNSQIIKNFEGFWEPNGTLNSIQNFEPGKAYFYKK
ncbi:MAG TPA: glycosyl hydrolase family 8 [Bacteroidales bacterium]|nr:glycosyl hydrolase family 8 [Bacteroidales bacterium]